MEVVYCIMSDCL